MIWNKIFDVENSWQMVCWFWLTLDSLNGSLVSCLLPLDPPASLCPLLSKLRLIMKVRGWEKTELSIANWEMLKGNFEIVCSKGMWCVTSPGERYTCAVLWITKTEKKKTTTKMGFEPTRAEHIGLAVQRLNHSATSSDNDWPITH